ncbi:G-type lectin S-receptor-like serine/threonine-protein kinase RKS1 isoform X2 [Ziziphus jujuba]|uniref:Receptor-like serine/threonine-protein kinase n=1 Tax=Ziziphus jujuba TaxID=326968 RepID=A0A6P4A146_ZIZJJ|nr:G-type lectin S-receptor-like serine/threonine-protein kinase RKS1 isoform X2 [Ziziphus jujuba]
MLLQGTLLLFLLLPFCSSTRDTITQNQSIKDGEYSLFSKEMKFELGFFSPGNTTNRYVGIWYAKLPEKTVVWVANRNNPINDTSGILTIDRYGNLLLYAHHNNEIPIWHTNVSVQLSKNSSAQLLDTGNFILIQEENNKNILWQSFDHLTDTFLPHMKLGLNRRTGLNWYLTSWKSLDDPESGEYSYRLDVNSSQFFLYRGSTRYWRNGDWPWKKVPFIVSFDMYTYSFWDNEDEICGTYFSDDANKITRVVVNDSGSLQHLEWNVADSQWKEVWSAPKYQCDPYGHCSANSKCSPDNVNKFECECLPGYEPKSPTVWYQRNGSDGCKSKAVGSSHCGNREGFLKMTNMNVPDTSGARLGENMSETECKNACLRDCSCVAFVSIEAKEGSSCLAWHEDLMDILEYTESGYNLSVRVTDDLAENPRTSKGVTRKRIMHAVIFSFAGLALLLGMIFAYWWLKKKRKLRYEHEETRTEPADLPFYHLSTIIAATDNFSPANKLGEGGFGSVHMGRLSNGQNIAVKRLSKSSGQGVVEFETEVMLMTKLQHRNLVKLLGCCIQGEEKMLIYEYMPNKSLDSFIFDQAKRSLLDWRKRFDIIIGIARGLLYLHQDSRLRIIHRDLKASNVLLDVEMNSKISDFGMARIFNGDKIQDKTNRVVGTFGYMSPEYALFGKFSTKSDVFSFGVLLLEIVSGMKNNGCCPENASMNLIEHVWNLWREERALEIVDSCIKPSYIPDETLRCIQIGLLCVQERDKDRPTMSAVVLMLNCEIALPSPKEPAYVLRRNYKDTDLIGTQGSYSENEMNITEIVAR